MFAHQIKCRKMLNIHLEESVKELRREAEEEGFQSSEDRNF